jgi:uncharacterized protein (TIGR00369 family)
MNDDAPSAGPDAPRAAGTPLPFPIHIPFVEELGLELHAFGAGAAEIQVDLATAHLNSFAVAHGGVLMTMLDVAMAHAARSVDVQPGTDPRDAQGVPGVVTIEMKTSFMRPSQGRLRATAQLLHRTSTMAFCEGSVFDAKGQRCAHATATFKYMRLLPAGRQLKTLRGPAPE